MKESQDLLLLGLLSTKRTTLYPDIILIQLSVERLTPQSGTSEETVEWEIREL